jgi:hypothetical protein
MKFSRPVIAFALLRQSSEALKTDLLSGLSILVRPLVADLAGQMYDASLLAQRMADSYGISLPSSALEGFMPRLIAAGVLQKVQTPTGIPHVVYSEQEAVPVVNPEEEREFQEIIDDFLQHARGLLAKSKRDVSQDVLVAGFLKHLSTFDFSAVRARPTVPESPSGGTIEGPAARENRALSATLADDAAIDVLVASYISKLNVENPTRLALVMRVADGALGAELVLDLQAPTSVPRLSNTTVVVDTPILLSYLDLSSKQECEAARELVAQITAAGAKVAAFRHSIEEAEGVLTAVQSARTTGEAYGRLVARLANSHYRAFFESMIGRVGRIWQDKFEIIQEAATHFYKNFSADEEEALTQTIRLSVLDRRLTRERDAKSVAETIRRLGGAHISVNQVAACPYMFVTPNALVRRHAARFLKEKGFVRTGEFNPIVTDRYISGMCWLIAGGRSEHSPSTARLLANCAAALRLRPELAERTKRFLAGLDEEKARHFEALMTNDRASQYLMEVTAGDVGALTAALAEDVFEEAQRRAAEKVGKEKDEHYADQIAELRSLAADEARRAAELREQLTSTSIEASAKAMEAEQRGRESARLQSQVDSQAGHLQEQARQIDELSGAVGGLKRAAATAQSDLNRHRLAARNAARRYADRMALAARISGAVLLFVVVFALGYVDKFLTPTLNTDRQNLVNDAVISAQALLGILGVSVLADWAFRKPLRRWRNGIYKEKLLEYGFVYSEEEEGAVGEKSVGPSAQR